MKIISTLFAASLLFAVLVVEVSSTAQPTMSVFACEPEWAALTKVIGGERVTVFSATTAKQDPHYIRAKPSLIAKIRRSDLLICTGADLEAGWLPILLQRAPNSLQPGQAGYLMATDHVQLLDQRPDADRSDGHIHPQGNPHIHTHPYHLLVIAAELSKRLQLIDADHRQHYDANFKQFEQQWRQAITRWEQQAESLKSKRVVVHHASWRYLADWLGLEVIATLEAKPGIPPTTRHLQSVLDVVRARGPVLGIVRTPYDPLNASNWLADKTGLPAIELPYTVGGSDDATDLFRLYDQTLIQLTDAAQ